MALVLDSTLKIDGKVYPEGTAFNGLPKKVKEAARDAGIVASKISQEEIDELATLDEADLSDDEDEDGVEEAK